MNGQSYQGEIMGKSFIYYFEIYVCIKLNKLTCLYLLLTILIN